LGAPNGLVNPQLPLGLAALYYTNLGFDALEKFSMLQYKFTYPAADQTYD
jgi:hypothetical protein